ncbi:MAG: Non-ribosomal peptide synthetase [Verrucomicrobiales bacterium]|nr:Non-ribosomal peptide synthetase [Verrucomicrobiales bacterium]
MDNVADIFELSPAQEGMLFHSLSAPGSGIYMERLTAVFDGSLDVAKFQESWKLVLTRHPILRSAVFWEDVEKPLQVVFREISLDWRIFDWAKLPEKEFLAKWGEFISKVQLEDFVLTEAPLMRWALVRQSPTRWRFSWWHHHMLLDGWGVPMVLKEVFDFYNSAVLGMKLSVTEAPSYREYILWLQQQNSVAAAKFWNDYIADYEQPNSLRFLNKENNAGIAEETVELSRDLVESIQRLAAESKTTLNMVFQAAWALLLHHYTRTEDVVFGTTVTVRPDDLAGIEQMIGLFINTIPVRINTGKAASVTQLLASLMDDHSRKQPFLFYSLAEIQAKAGNGRTLFESILVFENYPVDAEGIRPGGLKISQIENEENTNYPITVVILPGDKFLVKLAYHSSSFEADWIKSLMLHFQNLLSGLCSQPGRKPQQIPLISSEERRFLTSMGQPMELIKNGLWADKCALIHTIFLQQALSHPDKVAVAFGSKSICYGDLDRAANIIANRLIAEGVKPGAIVGICLERSPAMVIGILGILKAGAAYLPIDSSSPSERIKFMLEDSRASLFLVDNSGPDGLMFSSSNCKLVFWQEWQSAEKSGFEYCPDIEILEEAPAYVIYTSGSTGKPKGVVVSHKNVIRLFQSTDQWFKFNHSDVWTLFHSFAFDFSVWEMWGALLFGGKLIVVPYEISRSPELFVSLVSKERVTILNQTPAAFREFIAIDESLLARDFHLRFVIFGGEALDFQMLHSWFDRHGDQQPALINMYGITETTVHVTYRRIRKNELQTKSLIGVPLNDLSLFVLDDNGEPLPLGVVGELFVGGLGVAQGYLFRPDLTADRFIPDSFGGKPGSRLYRTGDLGRRMGAEDVEYCGRADHQVKIRGHRIELGEIEEVIQSHPDVKWAKVQVRGETVNRHLVAYVLGTEALANISTLQWRQFSGKRLPEYMIPSFFVVIQAVPLTVNGKVDWRALPIPKAEGDKKELENATYNEIERKIATAWEEDLEIKNPGLDTNFFELGGHSLLAIRVH